MIIGVLLLLVILLAAGLSRLLVRALRPPQASPDALDSWRNPALDSDDAGEFSDSLRFGPLPGECFLRAVMLGISVAICYKLVWISFAGFVHSLETDRQISYLMLLYSIAWSFYFLMGLAWIANVRLGLVVAAIGTIFGVLAFISAAVFVLPIPLLIAPVYLAARMARFHSAEATPFS